MGARNKFHKSAQNKQMIKHNRAAISGYNTNHDNKMNKKVIALKHKGTC